MFDNFDFRKYNMSVKFFFLDTKVTLTNRTALKRFISKIFKTERIKLGSLSYIFCTDEHLLQINKQYLNHNYYTDIITFDLSNDSESVSGDIYISIDRVKDNARIERVSVKEELHRVIFHGALHLCGYKDKNQADKSEMTAAEDHHLNLYFH